MPKAMTPEIGNLFTDYTEQRAELKKMVLDLEKVKAKIDTLFPDQVTARNRFQFDEKIKTASALFSSLLEIRKEIIKSLKDEIELRRRFDIEEREAEESDDEIREIAGRIEELSGVKLTVIKAFKPVEGEKVEKVEAPKEEEKLLDDGYVRLDELDKLADKEEKIS
jgi:hypothetical protein